MAGGKPGPKNVTVLKPNPNDREWQDRWRRDVIVYADNDDVWGNTDPLQKHCGMFRGEFGAGDVISYLADGGGGYGEPFARDPERVREDVIDGYVSAEAARTDYGVALTEANAVDWDATKRLRG